MPEGPALGNTSLPQLGSTHLRMTTILGLSYGNRPRSGMLKCASFATSVKGTPGKQEDVLI